ncbi:MAG: hypothetical protein Q7R41_03270 [Phycisphaerales bacterium]|nr:hypothetical protein [Phycisphaerales bacterium]
MLSIAEEAGTGPSVGPPDPAGPKLTCAFTGNVEVNVPPVASTLVAVIEPIGWGGLVGRETYTSHCDPAQVPPTTVIGEQLTRLNDINWIGTVCEAGSGPGSGKHINP